MDGPRFPRHLLVLAHGVGQCDLEARLDGPVIPLTVSAVPAATLLEALPAAELRELGLEVDRAGVLLRPEWRSDEATFAAPLRRAAGPAEATVLESVDVLAGLPTATLFERLDRLGAQLGCGRPVGLWFAALGRAVPVDTTIDLWRVLRAQLRGAERRRLAVRVERHRAVVHSDSQRVLDRCADALLRRVGRNLVLRHEGAGTLAFWPPAGAAFGSRPVRARAPLPHEADAAAALPMPTTAQRLDLPGLAARFAAAAAALAPDLMPAAQAGAGTFEGAPDLLALLRAGRPVQESRPPGT